MHGRLAADSNRQIFRALLLNHVRLSPMPKYYWNTEQGIGRTKLPLPGYPAFTGESVQASAFAYRISEIGASSCLFVQEICTQAWASRSAQLQLDAWHACGRQLFLRPSSHVSCDGSCRDMGATNEGILVATREKAITYYIESSWIRHAASAAWANSVASSCCHVSTCDVRVC